MFEQTEWLAAGARGADPAQWYALHTRSNFEIRIAGELAAKGIEPYLPAYDEIHQWKDRKKKVSVPLFPGYVFANFADCAQLRATVVRTPGVVRILGRAGAIEPVPDEQLAAVRRLLSSNSRCFSHPFLKQGARVRMRRGPLKGLQGILVRAKNGARLVISIPLLSQSAAAEVDVRDVETISP